MNSTVERAREIVTRLYERNLVSWNDLDREVVFVIQALNAEVQRLEALAQPKQEARNFCPRCGKRRGGDVNYIHTCVPPRGLEMT